MSKCRLTERIVIQEYSEIQDNEGFDNKIWSNFYECWSNFKKVSGKEYESAKAIQAQNTVTFTVRYCNKIKKLLNLKDMKKFRIIFNSQIYNIQYCYDFKNQHNWVDIKGECIE